ncbi:hypothetical protein BLNAU_8353 [Blattamonas nauphoetae]|uniref:Rho-GAP domain-containing protein n=1 Tax=Blattamonas nauphoetae TaxID=2049346 RepID=A0ABQ9XZ27_9EUKA|nr:hypothetical protein BLNAU_8353 [Blattamonas nauphoetae]
MTQEENAVENWELSLLTTINPTEIEYFSPSFKIQGPQKTRCLSNSLFAECIGDIIVYELPPSVYDKIKANTFIEYANQTFTEHSKGFKKLYTNEELTKYSKDVLKKPLQKMPEQNHAKLKDEGGKMYFDLLVYMGDATAKGTKPEHHMNEFLRRATTVPELRNEAFCEIMKQINNHPKEETALLAWKLLVILLDAVCVGEDILPTLLLFIHTHQQKEKEKNAIVFTPLFRITSLCIAKIYMSYAVAREDRPISDLYAARAPTDLVNQTCFGVGLDDIFISQILLPDYLPASGPHISNSVLPVPKILAVICNSFEVDRVSKEKNPIELFGSTIPKQELERCKAAIDMGNYSLDTHDFLVYSSLLKAWLKSLRNPLISPTFNDLLLDNKANQGALHIIDTQLCNAHFYTLKYLIRFIRRIALHSDPETQQRNISQLSHYISLQIVSFPVSKDPRAEMQKITSFQDIFQDMIMSIAVSPEEEQRFQEIDASVRQEYKLNGIRLDL